MGGTQHRRAKIAFTIRTVLEQLPEPVAVTLRRIYRVATLDDKEPIGRSSKVKLLNHPARNHQIIAFRKSQFPKLRLQRAAPLVHKNHLVVLRILIEVIRHGCCGGSKSDGTVLIGQDRHTTFQVILSWFYIKSFESVGLHVVLNGNLRCNVDAFAHLFHHGWRMIVVQQRGHAVKAYSPEKFFMIQLPIFLAELGMTLVWKLSLLLI